jgi:hypothetical protein
MAIGTKNLGFIDLSLDGMNWIPVGNHHANGQVFAGHMMKFQNYRIVFAAFFTGMREKILKDKVPGSLSCQKFPGLYILQVLFFVRFIPILPVRLVAFPTGWVTNTQAGIPEVEISFWFLLLAGCAFFHTVYSGHTGTSRASVF